MEEWNLGPGSAFGNEGLRVDRTIKNMARIEMRQGRDHNLNARHGAGTHYWA